jgi:hypothetical protein
VNAGERSIFKNKWTKTIRINDQNRSVETRRSTKLQISNRVICQSELHEISSAFNTAAKRGIATAAAILCRAEESCQ